MSESELIKLAQRGDRAAFDRLMALHGGRLDRLCDRLARRPADRDDAKQEALIALWRGLPKFKARDGALFTTWMYRVSVNAVNGMYRRKHLESVGPPPESIEGAGSGPESAVVASEAVRWALNQLPDKFRATIVLTDLEDLDYEVVAHIQGIRESTVKSRVHRARRALKHLLGGDYG